MVLAIGSGEGIEGNHQQATGVGLNNDSLLAIESDLVAIEEKELENMYQLENSTSSIQNHPHSSHLDPSMKGFMEHMAFHLWFFLPCVILLVPPQPKFIDKIVQVSKKGTVFKNYSKKSHLQHCKHISKINN